jgi:hypothetical protein
MKRSLLLVAVLSVAVAAGAADADTKDLPILIQAPSKPYEVVETYLWEGKPSNLDDVLAGMAEKAKKLGNADALLVRETERCDGQMVTRVLARAIHYTRYEGTDVCRKCHDRIYDQYALSMHSKAASNPVFLAQYFNELFPRLAREPQLAEEADHCTACHNPVEFMTHNRYMTSRPAVTSTQREVTCEFCHTIPGQVGNVPGNGNYRSAPGDRKKGPIREQSWHYEYSTFVRSSEFCGMCHNATNHNGLVIKSTYDEWAASEYARAKVQCQDCHMNREGYLIGDRAEFDRGRLTSSFMPTRMNTRRRIYDHRFPGAHTMKQIDGSLGLAVRTDEAVYAPGQRVTATVTVDNARAGHCMPTGSIDLRLLWLEVRAFVDGAEVPVEMMSEGSNIRYAVAGADPSGMPFTRDIPKGSRVYRAIFDDVGGRPTLSSYDAQMVVFDNRLKAGEVRDEIYRFTLPPSAKGPVVIHASLKYLRYSTLFARKLGIPVLQPHEIAAASREARVRPQP